ncbi:uncharacterized protein LOC134196747 [Corticium candelabrum]|uniref:uncharacterized protein LOC134196747 n=1 Tax=Corticium candelabrum TaxID=121492 RepID=UPI002E255006|nr:uncharacterized protein LOC134196747 [Corticium candelabrum]
MKTPFSAVVLLFLHQVFFTSASDMIGNRSRWMSFGAKLEEVTFTDGQMRLAAVCDHGAQMDGECCSTSDYIPINPTKGYEFSIYIKSTASDMLNSFGFYVYNESKKRILNPNLNDPYFKNSDNDSNVWTKWTGYILPFHMSDSNSDSQPDSQFDEANGVDWKWPRYAKYVAVRFGSCANDSQNSKRVIVRRHFPHIDSTSVPTSDSVKSTEYEDVTPTSYDTKFTLTDDSPGPFAGTSESNPVPGTAAPTAPPTSPSTAPPTSPSTAPPTSPSTAPPTSPPTSPSTAPPTSPPTSPSTAPPTSPSTAPSTSPPTSPPPVTPALDKTLYLNLSFRELQASRRPEHVVRTFNISDFHEWASKPNNTKANTAIAKMVEGKEEKCYYPWGITHRFDIDSSKSYEFSVYIKSTQLDLHNFLGFQVYDKDKNVLTYPLLPSDYQQYYSNVTTTPYFKRSNNDTNEWTRWNGFVLPDGTDDIFSHLKGRNWVWPRGAKYAQLRFGTCYGKGNDQGITYFALPLVVQTDF